MLWEHLHQILHILTMTFFSERTGITQAIHWKLPLLELQQPDAGTGSPDNTDNGVGERKGVRTSTDAKDWFI